MPVSKVVSTAIVALFLGSTASFAQVLGAAQPAEFPPASYKGKQYVDSKGCVYIRAGVAGNVTWVPRVTRARQPICGAKPTFAKAAPVPEPKKAPVTKVAKAPAPKPAPKPKPVTVAKAKPAPKAVKAPMRTVASTPVKTRTVAVQPVKPTRIVAAPAPKRVAPTKMAAPKRVASCANLGVSGRYMQGSDVRCGPQAESPISYGSGTGRVVQAPVVRAPIETVAAAPVPRKQVVTAATVAPTTRVVRKHIYQQQVNSTDGVHVPEGYRPVWKDDRLNTKRAHGTFQGKGTMDLVWTQTVPRKLVDRRTGKDVTRFHPNLVYPYTDLATQQQTQAYKYMNSAKVSTKGTVKGAVQAKPRAVVSTKSSSKAVSGKKYVQVGTFGQPANAQRTAARLQQTGLPVRMARYSKGGRNYQIVLAGPFASPRDLNSALATARRAGFRDAFLR